MKNNWFFIWNFKPNLLPLHHTNKETEMENSNNLIHSFNHTPDTEGNFHGLTKREYFAGLAMQGMISEVFKHDGHELAHAETIAIRSLRCADELLKQLEK